MEEVGQGGSVCARALKQMIQWRELDAGDDSSAARSRAASPAPDVPCIWSAADESRCRSAHTIYVVLLLTNSRWQKFPEPRTTPCSQTTDLERTSKKGRTKVNGPGRLRFQEMFRPQLACGYCDAAMLPSPQYLGWVWKTMGPLDAPI